MTSFNPVHTIGRQLMEPLEIHLGMNKQQAWDRAVELLNMVQIPNAEDRMKDYPHQFSGGMRQRAMIAMALSCSPQVLIADEPTTALDVTIQAQIIDLVKSLRDELGMAIIWITHDLGVVAGLAERVNVMYAGYMVEESKVKDIYQSPEHPVYARAAEKPAAPGYGRKEAPGIDRRRSAGLVQNSKILPVRVTLHLSAWKNVCRKTRRFCRLEKTTKQPAG